MNKSNKNMFLYIMIMVVIMANLVMGIRIISFTNNIDASDREVISREYNVMDDKDKLEDKAKKQDSLDNNLDIVWGELRKEELNKYINFKGESSYSITGEYTEKGYIEVTDTDNKIKNAIVIINVNNYKSYKEINSNDIVNNRIDIDEKTNLVKGDECVIYILIEDSQGLRYKYILDKFNIDENGEVKRDNEDYGCVEIRDKTYNVLWEQVDKYMIEQGKSFI